MLNISLILDISYAELRSYFWANVAEDELLVLRVVNSIRIVIERSMYLGSLLVRGGKTKERCGSEYRILSNGEALACIEQAYTNVWLIYAPKLEDGVLLTINNSN
jgi:hypothetical protein